MLEQGVQRKIIAFLESERFHVIKVMRAAKAGEPDIVAFPDSQAIPPAGWAGWLIEVKLDKTKKLSPLQRHKLNELRSKGHIAFAAYGYADFKYKYQSVLVNGACPEAFLEPQVD